MLAIIMLIVMAIGVEWLLVQILPSVILRFPFCVVIFLLLVDHHTAQLFCTQVARERAHCLCESSTRGSLFLVSRFFGFDSFDVPSS